MADLYVALHHPGAMTTLVVIQARLGSTRLPGKVLLPLAGKPVLQHVVERAQRAGYPVVVAYPGEGVTPQAFALYDLLNTLGALGGGWVGNPADVLGRYRAVVERFPTDIVVRVTADCPCLDPSLIQRAVEAIKAGHDYAGNTRIRSWPRGLDVEAFTTNLLMQAHREAIDPYDREHVTPWMQRHAVNPGILQKRPGETPNATTSSRWCLDTPEDYAWLQEAFTQYPDPTTEQLASVRPLRLDYA